MNIIDRMEKGFTALQNCIDRPDAEGELYELLRLAKQGQQMRWVPVNERLPENKKKCWPTVVLCTNGKNIYKAYYVKHHEFNCEDFSYEGDGEYDEATDSYYWPEGWYECSSENEDIDWVLGEKITHWMPLPEPPKEDT